MEPRDTRTHAIIGAAMEVHRELGHGFLEAVYQEALAVEFNARQIPFEPHVHLIVHYKGVPLSCAYKPDFVVCQAVVVELKAIAKLTTVDQAQLINYLKATGIPIGLLLKLGAPSLEVKRLVLTPGYHRSADNSNLRNQDHEVRD